MNIEKKAGKACIAEARQIAKSCGVSVLAWNDKIGREFVSVEGDGDKLLLLQGKLEVLGWYTWPMDEEQEGFFMDFAMYPPEPLRTDPKIERRFDRIMADSDIRIPLNNAAKFSYNGANSLFLNNFFYLSLFAVLLIWLNKNAAAAGDVGPRIVYSAIAVVVAALLLLPFRWISLSADARELKIRKRLWGTFETIPISEIKKIKIFKETGRGKFKTSYVGINLESGKAFDVFLPKKQQLELMGFMSGKVS